METLTIETYTFDELSNAAKDRAIELFSDINTDYEWYDLVFEDAKAIGEIMGIDIDKIYFSGFSSQGDGACFVGKWRYNKNMRKAIREYAPIDTTLHSIAGNLFDIQRRNFYNIVATVNQSGRYYHEHCTSIDVENPERQYGEVDNRTIEDTKTELRRFMKWIYKTLEKEYDYLSSREAIIEAIEANEYTFTIDGERKLYL